MTFDEFYSEITNSLKQYDSANLIDKLSVYNWVLECIKRFGNLPTIKFEKVLEVKNMKAKLPDNFKSLKLALKCQPLSYNCNEEDDHLLQNTYFYKVINNSDITYNECDECCYDTKDSTIVEKIFLKNGRTADVRYGQVELLELVGYTKKDICTKGCFNTNLSNLKNKISINNKTLYASFNKGSIFIVYNGFEEDDDGYVMIPETNQGYLKMYIEYYVKRRIIEDIISNSDNTTNESTLYQLFQTQELQYFSLARTEMKFKDIGIGLNNYKNRIKREFSLYNFGGKSLIEKYGVRNNGISKR